MKYPPGYAKAALIGSIAGSVPASKAEDGAWFLEIKMKNHSAVLEFIHGRGNRGCLNAIVQMHNMARSLLLNGFGVDLTSIILESGDAIKAIAERKKLKDSYVLNAFEINALNSLLELHDAQLEVATVRDIEMARQHSINDFNRGHCHKLPSKFIGEKT